MRVLLLALFLVGGCKKAGFGPEVRTDVTARMETARPAISECYRKALREDRKLRGMIVVSFVAAATTGQFQAIQILRDDLGHQALSKCVVDEVAALKLETPKSSNVSITYPLDFAPTQ